MESFLGEVAADLYARYGEELSQRAVLFPSRRARLFFTDALARIARRPMWQPSWTTIDELMSEISGLRTGDRLDDGSLRVVDYKTGSPHLEFAGIGSLFRGEGRQRLSNIVQTLLYAMMLYRSEGSDATPALYYVRAMNRPDYSPLLDDRELSLRGARYSLYAERFEELVRETLAEMYDPAVPFRQCADADTCRYCDFNVICKRG